MKHLKNLIKATIEDSKAPWAISEGMTDMYKQDAKDSIYMHITGKD